MKTMKTMKTLLAAVCMTVFCSTAAFSQGMKVGDVINGVPSVSTDLITVQKIKAFFTKKNKAGSVIKDMAINVDPQNPQAFYLAVSGQNGVSVFVSRTTVVILDKEVFLATDPTTETCEGINCQQCAFASGGGCECKRKGTDTEEPSYCDHTISKPGLIAPVEQALDYGVTVSPNPTTGSIVVQLGTIANSVTSITITNNATQAVVASKNSNFQQAEIFDLSSNPRGNFTVKVLTRDGVMVTKSILLLK